MVDIKGTKLRYPISDKYHQYISELLYAPLKYHENSILICPPLYGRDHLVLQMWEKIQDRKKVLGEDFDKYRFAHINLVASATNPESVWFDQIEHALCISKGKISLFEEFEENVRFLLSDKLELVLFVNIPETLSNETFAKFLALAQKIYYIFPSKIHFLLIFDMKWNEDDFFKLTTPFRSLFQNTKLLPLFPDKTILYFINYYEHTWNLRLQNKVKEYIVEQSGGIMLLAKSVLRIARNERVNKLEELQLTISTHPDHKLQMNFFISRLTQRQQNIVKKISNLENVRDEEINHLERMGIVIKSSTSWRLRSMFLQNYLTDRKGTMSRKLKLIKDTKIFSEREKLILLKMVQHKETIIKRETIAEIIWSQQSFEKYSDWAIDQTISRIRKKLQKDPLLSGLIIQTHKKFGFCLK